MEDTVLRLRVEDDGKHARIVLDGEFDIDGLPAVNACLVDLASHNRRVLLDIGGVTFMDSKALALLIGVSKDAVENAWAFGITKPRHGAVERLFELTQASRLLPLRDEPDGSEASQVSNAPE